VAARSRRLLAHTWIYVPAVCGPVSGGLIKLDGGTTVAVVVVGVAPYAVWLLLLSVFVIGYLAALARYLWTGREGQDAMERLMVTTANAVVAILTLTAASPPPPRIHRAGAERANAQKGCPGRADNPVRKQRGLTGKGSPR
jgi:hypothetical protein